GNGSPNTTEVNFIFRTNDYAIQSAADATIRNNVVLGTIGLQSHGAGSPSNHRIVHNTVVNDGSAIQIRNVSGPVLIANNAFYSQSGSALQLISGNLGLVTTVANVANRGAQIGTDFVNGNFNGAPPLDVFPKTGSALIGVGSSTYVEAVDFNGTPRNGVADVGAYAYAPGGNPGWVLAAAFKLAQSDGTTPGPPTNLTVR